MELFCKKVNGFKLLTIFAKNSILDVRLCSAYASLINQLHSEVCLGHCQISLIGFFTKRVNGFDEVFVKKSINFYLLAISTKNLHPRCLTGY